MTGERAVDSGCDRGQPSRVRHVLIQRTELLLSEKPQDKQAGAIGDPRRSGHSSYSEPKNIPLRNNP